MSIVYGSQTGTIFPELVITSYDSVQKATLFIQLNNLPQLEQCSTYMFIPMLLQTPSRSSPTPHDVGKTMLSWYKKLILVQNTIFVQETSQNVILVQNIQKTYHGPDSGLQNTEAVQLLGYIWSQEFFFVYLLKQNSWDQIRPRSFMIFRPNSWDHITKNSWDRVYDVFLFFSANSWDQNMRLIVCVSS